MSQFTDPTDSLAPEAVWACVWDGLAHPGFDDVADQLARLRECTPAEARAVLKDAIETHEVRLRMDPDTGPYLAIDGAVSDRIGIRYTFQTLLLAGLRPDDIYSGNAADIIEAYQPMLNEALQEEGYKWPI
jgi:hypothetical protein